MLVLTILSKSALADLSAAKTETSERFLKPQAMAAPAFSARAAAGRMFRPAAAATPTQNVVGVGIDEKIVDGVPSGVPCIKFLVKQKLPKSTIGAGALLPKSISGYETDVEEVGLILPQATKAARGRRARRVGPRASSAMPNPRTKTRPAQPGSSVGFREPADAFVMAGTFGLLVKDNRGVLYVLSNNHVIAYESGFDAGGTKRIGLPVGAPIYQPGLLDGGAVATDKIAELTRWIDLRADRSDNKVDGAIAKLTPQSIALRDILFIGAPRGTATAVNDMVVHKFGRTTSYRAGRVTSVSFDVTIPYEVGDVIFLDQIAIRGLNGRRFSDSGDSGSAVLERATNKVVGLLFAGATNGSFTFANHIADVFAKLRINL